MHDQTMAGIWSWGTTMSTLCLLLLNDVAPAAPACLALSSVSHYEYCYTQPYTPIHGRSLSLTSNLLYYFEQLLVIIYRSIEALSTNY
jgi:hypothetical protein